VKIPLAREGIPFIGGFAAVGVVLWIAGLNVPAVIALVLAAGCAAFFRDPERIIPSEPNVIVSPADGKVLAVERVTGGTRISIFLSIFDVHINRAPIAGRVGSVRHTPGRFLAAFNRRASDVNERTTVPLEGQAGLVVVSQIAGVIARRIVCRAHEGDHLALGERFGMIRFGSRTDVLLPAGASVAVDVGARVRGGVSVVGHWDARISSEDGES
jgi:phosphatidylserine decarboxylase